MSGSPTAAASRASSSADLVSGRLAVTSVPVADPGDLLARLPGPTGLSWLRGGDGLVAWGEVARLEVSGPDRFAAASRWWAEQVARFDVSDDVEVPGSGPVAFASFTFDEGPSSSVVVVPEVVVGRRDGAAWVTRVGSADTSPVVDPVVEPGATAYSDGQLTPGGYERAVAAAVRRIGAGRLEKVVLARDLVATGEHPVDPRALLRRLGERYPSCWSYCVDGLVGATPELLVRRTGDHLVSRVLAGTIGRSTDAVVDAQHAAELLRSDKDRREHDLAVRSVAETLAPYCADLVVPRTPEIVRLANVQHLQTDVTGRLGNGETALDLAGALHPTAAVCGTPTGAAREAIRELEGFDRGRYAGPVGWVDARGDGAFGIALRCARVEGTRVVMYAGAGIVEGSVPAQELAETQDKFVAVRDALGS
jgi:menaquinone-specific isochorismate synthase